MFFALDFYLLEELALFQNKVSAYRGTQTSVYCSFNLITQCYTSEIAASVFKFLFYLIHFLHYCIVKNRVLAYFTRASPKGTRSSRVKHFQFLLPCPEMLVVVKQGCSKLSLVSLVLRSPVSHLGQRKRSGKVRPSTTLK